MKTSKLCAILVICTNIFMLMPAQAATCIGGLGAKQCGDKGWQYCTNGCCCPWSTQCGDGNQNCPFGK